MRQETKQCQNCQTDFEIEPDDFVFYDKIKVPPPTWCPECRMVRRMQWRNERTLYKRKCDAPEHNEDIISIYHKDSPVKVYDQKYWWSDNWDPMEYGRDYDFNKPFFEQFGELIRQAPQNNLVAENNVNSDYCNFQISSKDCYLVSGGASNENVLYANHVNYSKDSSDLYYSFKSELSYDNVICRSSYKLFFSQNCDGCSDSYFLYDCRNCQNCFGCVSLRNKQYHIFNKPHSKEEYKKKLEEFDLGNFDKLKEQKELFENFKLKYPRKFINASKTDNVSGDNVFEAKNCKLAFDVLPGGSENSKFVFWSGADMKDTYDGTGIGVKGELLYEGVSVAISDAKVSFSVAIRGSHDIKYSFNCHSSSDLFGCIGLKKKQYCILNKQYTKEEYEALVPRIINHMNSMPYISKKQNPSTGSGQVYKYGEFFPPELSPFCYNETIAQEYFPLTKEQAAEQGYNWKDPEPRNYQIDYKTEDLPDHIKDVDDSIVNKVIQCGHATQITDYGLQTTDYGSQTNTENSQHQSVSSQYKSVCNEQCTEAFKIIEPELDFYRKMNLPLPRLCPNCRHYQRIRQRNPLKLWHRKCQCAGSQSENGIYKNTIQHQHGDSLCPNEFETSYAPERPEIVYCEKCYQAEVV